MLIKFLLKNTELKSAETILQIRQQDYVMKLLKMSKEHLTQNILSVLFREKNQHAQLKKQSLEDQE